MVAARLGTNPRPCSRVRSADVDSGGADSSVWIGNVLNIGILLWSRSHCGWDLSHRGCSRGVSVLNSLRGNGARTIAPYTRPVSTAAGTRDVTISPVGELLRYWRGIRRLSQMALALRAGTTSRHVSFIETG